MELEKMWKNILLPRIVLKTFIRHLVQAKTISNIGQSRHKFMEILKELE